MSDAKTEYAMAVIEIKGRSREDEALAKKVQSSYLELRSYGANWAKANINEVVAEIAPGAHAEIEGRKICYYNSDRTMVVMADVAGYLRVARVTSANSKNKIHYLDVHGLTCMADPPTTTRMRMASSTAGSVPTGTPTRITESNTEMKCEVYHV